MDLDLFISTIGTVGFPIAVSGYLLIVISKAQVEQSKILTELTLLVKMLCEKEDINNERNRSFNQ